jgi:hypothetical protein
MLPHERQALTGIFWQLYPDMVYLFCPYKVYAGLCVAYNKYSQNYFLKNKHFTGKFDIIVSQAISYLYFLGG